MNFGRMVWLEITKLQQLLDLIKSSTVKAAGAKPGELAPLVAIHSEFQNFWDSHAGKQSGNPGLAPHLLDSIERVANLVEGAVMNDADEASIAEVVRQIAELHGIVAGTTSAQPRAKSAQAPADTPPPTIADEIVITENDVAMAIEFVGEASGHLDKAEASLLHLEEDPGDIEAVNSVFRAFHTIKGVAGFLGLKQIGALAHMSETLLDLARKGKLQLKDGILDVVLEARDVMGQMVHGVDVAAKSTSAPAIQPGLENLIQRLHSAARGDNIPPAAKTATPMRRVDDHPETATAASQANQSNNDGVVKVATGRLDALINAVGELVISQAMVTQDIGATTLVGDPRLARNLSHLGKITRGLQELSMSMRMVPIAAVFQKMARLARDTGRKAGKEIELVQIGGETELDRNVVEAISDPLVHMVRNSIDHGVEIPEDRVKVGKPRAGRVILKAFHQAGNVVVEITDDGKGLNKERIVQKAIAAGIVKEGQELTEQQIFQLIFHPGLSTAEKVTDISGRGVGMDVVRKNVEALRGRIEITSTQGVGSTFTLRLPLTLAVIDGLIVRVGTQRYIVPITSIEQSIRPTESQISTVQGKGELCMVRDRLLPIVRLYELFHVEPKTKDPTKALVVIVQEGSGRCCLLVDELIGQQQVVIKSVGKEIGELPGIAGCAILGDGNVSLILDVGGIIHSALK